MRNHTYPHAYINELLARIDELEERNRQTTNALAIMVSRDISLTPLINLLAATPPTKPIEPCDTHSL